MEDDEGVRVIRLAHGKVNALDLELTEALVDHFGQLGEASDVRAVVLTGSARGFSAGVDLRRIVDGGAAYVEQFLPTLADAFVSLFSLPMPVVAAVIAANAPIRIIHRPAARNPLRRQRNENSSCTVPAPW